MSFKNDSVLNEYMNQLTIQIAMKGMLIDVDCNNVACHARNGSVLSLTSRDYNTKDTRVGQAVFELVLLYLIKMPIEVPEIINL